MFFKTCIIVLLMMQCRFQDIKAEAQDIDTKLTELSNDIKQLAKTTEDTMLELRGEENYLLSILTGHQRALENKMDFVRNNQNDLNQALSQLRKNQDDMKQGQNEIKLAQNEMTQNLSQIKLSQDEMKQGQNQMKLTQEEMKQGQSQMKLTQEQMNQGQNQMKLTQNEMKQNLSQIKLSQEEMKEGQNQIKLTQEEMKQRQNQMKLTQDKDNNKINSILDAIKKLPCDLPVVGLKTQNFNGKRYYMSYDKPMMTWDKADKFCKSHGMELLSIDTQQEWNALKPEVEKLFSIFKWPCWSSGSDAAQEGKWKWTTTGTDVTFFGGKYDMSSGNKKDHNCLDIYAAGWGDAPCTNELSVICEQNTFC